MNTKEQLKFISQLEDNWDGEGAKAFRRELIDLCEKYLSVFPQPTGVFPTMRDTIQFEWECPNRDYLELEIGLSEVHSFQVLGRNYMAASNNVFHSDDIDAMLHLIEGFMKMRR